MRLLEVIEDSGNKSYEYTGSGQPNSIAFINDSNEDAVIAFAGHTITVKAEETFEISTVIPFYEVEITTNGSYRMFIGE